MRDLSFHIQALTETLTETITEAECNTEAINLAETDLTLTCKIRIFVNY